MFGQNYKSIIVVIGFILFFTAVMFSENRIVKPLSLSDCIELAGKNYETIKIQLQRINQAGYRVSQAKGEVYPDISFGYQKNFRDGGQGQYSRFYASQPLFRGLSEFRIIKALNSDRRVEEHRLKDAERNLNSDVAAAFYSLAAIESDLKNNNETIQEMMDRKKELDDRIRLGKSRQSEQLVVESQIAVLRSKEQSILAERAGAIETLAFFTGQEASAIKISDVQPEPQSLEPEDRILEKVFQRSDVLAAKEIVNGQDLRVKAARGEYFPTLDATGAWYTSRSGTLSGTDWDVYLLLNLPLFQGGSVRAQVKEQLSILSESEYNLSLTIKEIRTEVRQLYAALESSMAQVSSLKDAYDKSRQSYELNLKDYRLGLVNNLDVIQATLTLLEVKSSLDRTVLESKLNKTLLDIAIENK